MAYICSMALHTKTEFAALCGLLQKNLHTYIGRKKVIVGSNDLIDDTDQINRLFMDKQRAKRGIEGTTASAPGKQVPVKKSSKKEPSAAETEMKDTLTGLLKGNKELEMVERQNKIEMQRIEIQKKRGELVPTSAVKTVMTLHTESIKTSYIEASDNLILILSQRKGFN